MELGSGIKQSKSGVLTKPMLLKIRYLLGSVGLALVILLTCGLESPCQSPDSVSPSLECLKTLTYAKAKEGEQNEVVSYSELLNMLIACRAYSGGLSILPEFHEPILTRGETGIAVFRKVSPSVVLVVMARVSVRG